MSGPYRLTADNRLALLMHGHVTSPFGKMGFGLMRYSQAPVVVVIDRKTAGKSLSKVTGIHCDAPIVASVKEALELSPDVLVPAIAPAGGALPADWFPEIAEALSNGLSLVNGLHEPLASHPQLAPNLQACRFIWDIRKEPQGLTNGMGRARELKCRRVLMVGTDMANGKMTTAIEMHRLALKRGMKSRFMATGQIGIAIAGEGVPLDAVRIDFATGAVEAEVLRQGTDCDVLFIEGQGSLLHPASTAPLALLRGAMPTELILCHRAGQRTIARCPWVKIPSLGQVTLLYEEIARATLDYPDAMVAAISLNTSHLDDSGARRAIKAAQKSGMVPASDPVRFGADVLLDALFDE